MAAHLTDKQKGTLFIISGPSGAGKTSLLEEVIKQDKATSKQLTLSISYTTRAPRKGEVDGVNYFFVSTEQFQSMQQNSEFLESANVFDYLYGTSKHWVEKQLYEQKKDIILEIDVQGAMQVMEHELECCAIFIFPPSFDTLEKRLHGRQTDTSESIQKRLTIATKEMELGKQFHHNVINDDYQKAVAEIQTIIKKHSS